MLVSTWLVFLCSGLATPLASTPQRDADHYDSSSCMPVESHAPFGLDVQRYNEIYHSSQRQYHVLSAAQCSDTLLLDLSDCAWMQLTDIRDHLRAATQSCRAELSQSLNDVYQALVDYGCLEDIQFIKWETEAQGILQMITKIRQMPHIDTCHAVVESSRLAFRHALHGLVKSPEESNTATESMLSKQLGDSTDGEANMGAFASGHSLWAALIAGALAGLAVDLSLYPLDTIKTRLQSSAGFKNAGGLKGLYQGIGSISLGSAPSSALFFLAYEFVGKRLTRTLGDSFAGHLLATTIGELSASIVRVPADVVKSRQQVEAPDGTSEVATTLWIAIQERVDEEGQRAGKHFRLGPFYAGWLSTIVREIPFGCIQFPLFSYLKQVASDDATEPLSIPLTVVCGMVAGAAAGSLTTPLDVIKTRLMLAEHGEQSIRKVFLGLLRTEGLSGLFRGVIPRTLWISLGGAIFLGGYDVFSQLLGQIV